MIQLWKKKKKKILRDREMGLQWAANRTYLHTFVNSWLFVYMILGGFMSCHLICLFLREWQPVRSDDFVSPACIPRENVVSVPNYQSKKPLCACGIVSRHKEHLETQTSRAPTTVLRDCGSWFPSWVPAPKRSWEQVCSLWSSCSFWISQDLVYFSCHPSNTSLWDKNLSPPSLPLL